MKDTNTTAEVEKGRITHEPGVEDAWVCVCGNTPADDGFYPCNGKGIVVEPVIGGDWENLYICFRCGIIINKDTLEVVEKLNPKRIEFNYRK